MKNELNAVLRFITFLNAAEILESPILRSMPRWRTWKTSQVRRSYWWVLFSTANALHYSTTIANCVVC